MTIPVLRNHILLRNVSTSVLMSMQHKIKENNSFLLFQIFQNWNLFIWIKVQNLESIKAKKSQVKSCQSFKLCWNNTILVLHQYSNVWCWWRRRIEGKEQKRWKRKKNTTICLNLDCVSSGMVQFWHCIVQTTVKK